MIEILLDETDNIEFKTPIRQGVKDYNKAYLGDWNTKPFTLYIKDKEGHIIAGLFGRYIQGELIDIDYFWVEEKYRKQKLGTKLFKAAEDFGKKHKVRNINLYTMEFQALGFYKKLSFSLVTTIPKWARDYDAHFMRKEL